MGKNSSRWARALLALLVLLTLAPRPARALTDQSRTVRVAYPVQAGLTDFDQYGNRTGYTYEYLQEVAQYTGWDYEFVDFFGEADESLPLLMEQLERGELDLMGAILYTGELGERYDYAGHSYGVGETVLQIPYDASQNVVVNSQVAQSFRIAVVKTTGRSVRELEDYCAMNLITPEYVLCDTGEEQVRAVREGRADMLLNSSMNYLEGVRTVARFAPKPFYFVTTKGANTGLMAELNEAMLSIEQADPAFTTALYEKYFVSANDELVLSREERAYVNGAGPLQVGVLTGQPPYQYLGEDGEMRGISIDLLSYISEKAGLEFQPVRAKSQEELLELARTGRVDLVAGISYDYELARENALSLSRPYLSSQYILLMGVRGSEDELRGKRLALTRTTPYQSETVGTPVWFETVTECIQAVAGGEADYTYADAYTAQFYINLPAYQTLRLVPQSYAPRRICFGVVKPGRRELLSILNKCVTTVSEVDLQGITNRNTMQHSAYSLSDLVRQNPLGAVAFVVAVFLAIIAALLGFLRQRERAIRRNALELKKHFRAYALMNEYFYEYDFRTNTAVVALPERDGAAPRLLKYDFNAPAEGPEAEDIARFLEIIRSGDDGVREARFLCGGGERHWVRLALETVYDGDKPVYALGKINLIDEEWQEREELLKKSRLDSLTQLYNAESSRLLITEALEELGPGHRGALLTLDVDRFKHINDTFGHMQGDAVLRQVAELLRSSFRAEDLVCRPGGDEFLVYMRRVRDSRALEDKCADLCRRVRALELAAKPTVSLGAVLSRPGDTYESLFRAADEALYQVKGAGRDGYCLAERNEA